MFGSKMHVSGSFRPSKTKTGPIWFCLLSGLWYSHGGTISLREGIIMDGSKILLHKIKALLETVDARREQKAREEAAQKRPF